MRFEDEIRDSVYLAKYFENEDALTKFSLKFNGQLCIGMILIFFNFGLF